MAADVEPLGTLGSEEASAFACVQALGQNVEQFPGESLRSDELVELAHHLGIVGLRGGVDGNHSRCIAHAEHELASHLPMHIAGEGSQILDVGNVLLVVEDALVEV